MSKGPVESAERKKIVALLGQDKTPYAVAKETGRSRPTVCKIAREEGFELNVRATKKAAEARRDYALAARLELLNEGFDKAREILPEIKDPGDLQRWFVAVATGIDKRRLEDGEATSRDESHRYDHSAELEDYFRELDSFREENSQASSRESVDTAETNGKTA